MGLDNIKSATLRIGVLLSGIGALVLFCVIALSLIGKINVPLTPTLYYFAIASAVWIFAPRPWRFSRSRR
jgi:hypothetical protein